MGVAAVAVGARNGKRRRLAANSVLNGDGSGLVRMVPCCRLAGIYGLNGGVPRLKPICRLPTSLPFFQQPRGGLSCTDRELSPDTVWPPAMRRLPVKDNDTSTVFQRRA